MNGIFSSTPAPGSIRLLVGSQGLLLVQCSISWQLPDLPGLFRVLVVLMAIVATAALITSIIGEDRDSREPYWRRRHGR